VGNSSNAAGRAPQAVDIHLGQDHADERGAPEFVSTQIDEDADAAKDWWSESTDGQCSENASLFAASQSAPLNVV
jgi:hypothetical protein